LTKRSTAGVSLVELLVSTVVMSVVAAAMMSIVLVNYRTNAKVMAIQDNVDAVRSIKERIASDVREGRALGDVFGTEVTNNTTNPPLKYTIGSDRFPEAARNPIYGGTLPYIPQGWPAPPWRLSNTCLIVQIPVLDNHNDDPGGHKLNPAAVGWPTMIPQGWTGGGPPAPVNQDNVETHVYMVIRDPLVPGEFQMQMASYGGMAVPGYSPAVHTRGPQTLLKGIIGPLDAASNPKVFQFINRISQTGSPDDSIQPNGSHSPEYTGVVVNLEVKRHQMQNAVRRGISQTPIGMKIEVFMRNNALATSTGQPAGIGN
jgi:type II secretory pathway pseudopilin PulG